MGCFQSQQWIDIHYIDPLCITTAFYILLHRHSHISADSPDSLHIKTPLSPCRGDRAAEVLLIGQKRSGILLLISVVFLTGEGPGGSTWQSLIRLRFETTEFPTLLHPSTCEIPNLLYTWSLKKYLFRAGSPRIGHYREFPLPGGKAMHNSAV